MTLSTPFMQVFSRRIWDLLEVLENSANTPDQDFSGDAQKWPR
jgi:hypothetical protein